MGDLEARYYLYSVVANREVECTYMREVECTYMRSKGAKAGVRLDLACVCGTVTTDYSVTQTPLPGSTFTACQTKGRRQRMRG